jgi:hypothetical protein
MTIPSIPRNLLKTRISPKKLAELGIQSDNFLNDLKTGKIKIVDDEVAEDSSEDSNKEE